MKVPTQKSSRLKKGIIVKIAKAFDVHPNYVTAVKSGRRNNLSILEAIAKELDANNSQAARLRKKINQN
jgi:hypothetical protein